MENTINIFKHLFSRRPPLFPAESADSAQKYFAECENADDAEDGLIAFGYAVWPYQKAHQDFVGSAQEKFGEHFLLPKLSRELQNKILDLHQHGLNYEHIVSGKSAQYFTEPERAEIVAGIAQMNEELRAYVEREILAFRHDDYQQKVNEYQNILDQIKEKITALKNLSARVGGHDILANEIKERVRLFEQGLCTLAPEPTLADMDAAVEHFNGRWHDLNRLRGINVPVEVDFYGGREQ